MAPACGCENQDKIVGFTSYADADGPIWNWVRRGNQDVPASAAAPPEGEYENNEVFNLGETRVAELYRQFDSLCYCSDDVSPSPSSFDFTDGGEPAAAPTLAKSRVNYSDVYEGKYL